MEIKIKNIKIKNIKVKNIKVKDGDTFTVAGMEFIKFPEKDGQVPIVMKDIPFCSAFGQNNDFRSSEVLQKLTDEVLPKIVEAFGADALCPITTDLTTLDGLKCYGTVETLISIPTLDFYRKNVEIFDKHNPKKWWWLATAESAPQHNNGWWNLCVSPSGSIYYVGYYDEVRGVRPFLILKSFIFEYLEQ